MANPASARPLRIDSRRLRLTIEHPVEVHNAQGGATITWQPLITVWARIDARSGRERQDAGRLESAADTKITIRWRGTVDARMRFTGDARIFDIRSTFDPDGRRRDLVCLCEEITS
jgi:SPP1 family predicted phage head-tail adaptor